jgi:hypothetical protein
MWSWGVVEGYADSADRLKRETAASSVTFPPVSYTYDVPALCRAVLRAGAQQAPSAAQLRSTWWGVQYVIEALKHNAQQSRTAGVFYLLLNAACSLTLLLTSYLAANTPPPAWVPVWLLWMVRVLAGVCTVNNIMVYAAAADNAEVSDACRRLLELAHDAGNFIRTHPDCDARRIMATCDDCFVPDLPWTVHDIHSKWVAILRMPRSNGTASV